MDFLRVRLGKSVENDTWVNAHAMEGKIVAIYMNGETFKDDELEFVVATEGNAEPADGRRQPSSGKRSISGATTLSARSSPPTE